MAVPQASECKPDSQQTVCPPQPQEETQTVFQQETVLGSGKPLTFTGYSVLLPFDWLSLANNIFRRFIVLLIFVAGYYVYRRDAERLDKGIPGEQGTGVAKAG